MSNMQKNFDETTLKKRIDKNTKLVIKQIRVYNQFSNDFFDIIKAYKTPTHICAYAAAANVRILKEFGIEQGLNKMKEINFLKKYMEEMMIFIFKNRITYALGKWQKDKDQITKYCTEWVANYELSDYMKTLALENVYIFRHVGLYHPKLFEKTENQERERIIQDETPFKDQPYFIYYPKENKYIDRNQFQIQDDHFYIFDTMGHFICGWVKNKDKNNKDITILETIPDIDSKDNKQLLIFFS